MSAKGNVTALSESPRRPARVPRSLNHRPVRESPNRLAELSSIQNALLQVLRARGGRLWMVDLVFELRWRGAAADAVRRQLDELVERGLVRGPLAQLAYELTASGWDLSRAP